MISHKIVLQKHDFKEIHEIVLHKHDFKEKKKKKKNRPSLEIVLRKHDFKEFFFFKNLA
jgi:hypothetical protein